MLFFHSLTAVAHIAFSSTTSKYQWRRQKVLQFSYLEHIFVKLTLEKCQINKINDDISVSEKFDMIKETYCIIINNAIRQCVTCLAS